MHINHLSVVFGVYDICNYTEFLRGGFFTMPRSLGAIVTALVEKH